MTHEENNEDLISLDLTAMFTDPKMKVWVKRFEKPIKFMTKISVLEVYHNRVDQDVSEHSVWEKWLKHLQIHYQALDGSKQIPTCGPIILTANHPFGMIDGIVLIAMVKKLRQDVKIMTNQSLQPVSGMSEDIIGVDPYEHATGKRANLAPIRNTLQWLNEGGALIVFPSGDVSHYDHHSHQVIDPNWNPLIGKIALKTQADIIPTYIKGSNSAIFHRLRQINDRIGSFMLARECLKKRGQTIEFKIGDPLTNQELQTMKNAEAVINYSREKTYQLAN